MKRLNNWLLGAALVAGIVGYCSKPANALVSNQTVQTTTALGNGVTTNYTISFDFRDNTQIVVTQVDTSTSPATSANVPQGAGAGKFTVTGGNPGTTVVMGTAPSATQYEVISRSIPITQTTHFDPAAAFPTTNTELTLDQQTLLIQNLNATVSQKVGLSPYSSASPTPTIPDPVANNFLLYDSTPRNITVWPGNASLVTGDFPYWNGSAWTRGAWTSAGIAAMFNGGGGVLAGTAGGTGVNNGGTLTWGGNNLTFTLSGATNLTLPSGSSSLLTSPMTTLGDTMYGGAVGTVSRLAGDTTNADVFFSEKSIAGVATAPTWKASTGSGSVVLSTSPILVNPALGTPTALVGTNISGTAAGLTAGNVTTNANMTGDVTSVGNATTIAANAVSNAKAAQMAQHTFKGNNTGGTANAADLTATQLTAELNSVVGDSGAGGTKGLVPAPGAGDAAAGKFLKADGTFAVPPGSGTITGPGASVDNEMVLWNSTTGTVIKRATGTGVAHLTSGVLSVATTTIGEGGTGQTTKAAAFDALSPNTTKGDVEVYSSTNIRHGVPGDYGSMVPDTGATDGWRNITYAQRHLGTGYKNYIQYADFENNATTGWTSTGCATLSAGIPTCVGSGAAAFSSSNGGRTKGANTSAPAIDSTSAIDGTYAMNLATTGAGTIGDGYVSSAYAIDPKDRGATFSYLIPYKIASGTAVTGGTATDTYAVVFYDPANNSFITPSNPFCVTKASGQGSCGGYFNTSTTTVSIQAFVYSPVAPVGASSLLFDNVNVGTQLLATGPPMTDPVAWTPTFTGFGTAASINCTSYRNGPVLRATCTFTTGTTTATEARISLGYNGADSNVTTTSTLPTLAVAGSCDGGSSSTTNFQSFDVLMEASKSYVTFGMHSSTLNGLAKQNGSAAFNNATTYSCRWEVPISGWSSNTVMASSTNNSPTVQKLTSGSGTYTTPAGVKWIKVRMVGAGGGGGGDTAGDGGNGSAASTFGTSLLTANVGNGGLHQGAGGAGGTATVAAPATQLVALTGANGTGGHILSTALSQISGGLGGVSPFGGAGGGAPNGTGTAAVANTGSGGSGGSDTATGSGGGGGAGGYLEAIIVNPAASYAWAVGTGGTAGSGGGRSGTAGGSGFIVVEEYYLPNPNVGIDQDNITSVSANYTVGATDRTVTVTSSATLTLPSSAQVKGRKYDFSSGGSSVDVTITPPSGTICGQSSIKLTGGESGAFQADGTNYIGLNGACEKTVRAIVNLSGASTCSITSQSGDWVTSVAAASSICTLTLITGGFSAAPTCNGNLNSTGGLRGVGINASSATSVAFAEYDQVPAKNTGEINIICRGPR